MLKKQYEIRTVFLHKIFCNICVKSHISFILDLWYNVDIYWGCVYENT